MSGRNYGRDYDYDIPAYMTKKIKRKRGVCLSHLLSLLITAALLVSFFCYYIYTTDAFINGVYSVKKGLSGKGFSFSLSSETLISVDGIPLIGEYSKKDTTTLEGSTEYDVAKQSLDLRGTVTAPDGSEKEISLELNGITYSYGEGRDGELDYSKGENKSLENFWTGMKRCKNASLPLLLFFRFTDAYKKNITDNYDFSFADGRKKIKADVPPETLLKIVKKNRKTVKGILDSTGMKLISDYIIDNADTYLDDEHLKKCGLTMTKDKDGKPRKIEAKIEFEGDLGEIISSVAGSSIVDSFISDEMTATLGYNAKIEISDNK
jgi:hypothetical protein